MNEINRLRALQAEDKSKARIAFKRILDQLEDDPIRRFCFVRDAAVMGIDDAIHYVVAAYREGAGVEPDRRKAFEWINKAANDELDNFPFERACCYRDGDGTDRDVSRFRQEMINAAKSGDTEAMFELAITYLDAEFGEPSVEQAIYWTNRMAEQREPSALIQLAKRYGDGDGVEKSDEKYLSYAKKAVEESRRRLRRRGNSRAHSDVDWVSEDLPESLAVLADALRRKGDVREARKHDKSAADAAADAINEASAMSAHVGQLLPEIMLRKLPYYKAKSGAVRLADAEKYREWLDRTYAAVKLVYSHDPTAIPGDLVNAIYELGTAYLDGTGGLVDETRAFRLLSEAAEAGHGRAAYLYAIHRLDARDRLGFNRFIEMASKANDMDAMIAQQLAGIGFVGKKFKASLAALQELRAKVIDIRNTKHRVSPEDVSNGIAHYTDSGALASMLSGGASDGRNAVRLSSTVYVNDPTEGQRLREFRPANGANPLAALYKGVKNPDALSWQGRDFQVFIACFSLQTDSLNLWRFYGRNGTGFSIVSPMPVFDAESRDGMLRGPWSKTKPVAGKLALHLVCYSDEHVRDTLSELEEALRPLGEVLKHTGRERATRLQELAIAVMGDLLYLYKDAQYADEKEVRAIQARTLGDPEIKTFQPGGKAYSRLYLETGALFFREAGSKIIIGPKVDEADSVELDLRHRLAQNGWSATCSVGRSDARYR